MNRGEPPPFARIAIITGAALGFNPRAFKEAMALAGAGHEVTVLGSNWDPAQFELDQIQARTNGFTYESAIASTGIGALDRVRSLSGRLRTRIGKEAFRYLSVESPWQLGPLVSHLRRRASAMRADYHIVHLEQAAWVGRHFIRAGKPVGVDMEDWYSEDLLPEARKQRPIRLLRELERTLLLGAGHVTCPSRAMSAALTDAYGCPPPAVIYNAFPWSDRRSLDGARKDRRNPASVSVHWVSQVLGPGRGLEDLFTALPMVRGDVEIHLRGTRPRGFEAWLEANVAASHRDRIFVHDLVETKELLSRIAEHDIGFAGEMKYCASKDLTVSNKILHYLLGGCAVVASDTIGQKEVATMAGDAVSIYPSGNPGALADALNALIDSPDRLNAAKAAALRAAEKTFCWERQAGEFVDIVTQAVRRAGASR